MEEAKHGGAAVLDLHDLEAAHVLGLNEAKRVIHAERQGDTNITLGEHLGRARAHHRRGRGEGGRLDGKSGKHD